MFVCLEGVDGAGKTSLATEISQELRRIYPDDKHIDVHSGPLEGDPLDEYAFAFEDYRAGEGVHIVADRLHWGECIYGEIYRDGSALDEPAFRWVELYLKARGVAVWHVTQDLGTLYKRLKNRGEDFLEKRHVALVRNRYYEIDESSITSAGMILPVGEMGEKIDEMLIQSAYYEQVATITSPWPQYIGRHVPHTLLVGDKRGGTPPHPTQAPFMARGMSSGRFLLDALGEEFWRGVGIVNINEVDDFPRLVSALAEPSIVALGREASDALLAIDIEHGAVPHPAYAQRFHRRLKIEYGNLIVDASRHGLVKTSWPN